MKSFCLALMLLTTIGWTPALLALRNHWVRMHPAHLIQTHGITHALYQGLGTVPNPWGIVYGDDASGATAVRQIDPSVVFATPAYYDKIRDLYVGLCRHQLPTVLRIYFKKTVDVLRLPLRFLGLPLGCWWLGLGFLEIRIPRAAAGTTAVYLSRSAALFLAFFIVQGILISPEVRFLYPEKILTILWLLLISLRSRRMPLESVEPNRLPEGLE